MATGDKAPFDVSSAPVLLGFPGGKIESIEPYLPDVYWVIVQAADGRSDVKTVVVDHGRIDTSHGRAAAARYLRRVRIDEHAD